MVKSDTDLLSDHESIECLFLEIRADSHVVVRRTNVRGETELRRGSRIGHNGGRRSRGAGVTFGVQAEVPGRVRECRRSNLRRASAQQG
jgi:hypothetical protein